MRVRPIIHIFLVLLLLSSCGRTSDDTTVAIGSKKFTESVILAELLAQLVESTGARVDLKAELGGTRVLWSALVRGDIDLYPEYTGTITKEILADDYIDNTMELRRELSKFGIGMSEPLGFNNTYALGMQNELAKKLGIENISDLRKHPDLKLGFGNEFMDRADGWGELRTAYNLPHSDVRGLDHDLAYRGLASGAIDVIDLYSTDAEINYYDLKVLGDDYNYFPQYDAVILYREDLVQRAPDVVSTVLSLEGVITPQEMVHMNATAKIVGEPESQIAMNFLNQKFSLESKVGKESFLSRLIKNTKQHLFLVAISLGSAILISIPLGVLAYLREGVGKAVLAIVGVIQTIPSLALLVFMIPFFGIGTVPAIVALFLYSLLPIVRNTYSGLMNISPEIKESVQALGLSRFAMLRMIELPLASRSILAGIKTSAVINVGTATLGALIGAGGYGQPILTGIRLDNIGLILEGAVPAAVLALLVQGLFDLLEHVVVPRGLRLSN